MGTLYNPRRKPKEFDLAALLSGRVEVSQLQLPIAITDITALLDAARKSNMRVRQLDVQLKTLRRKMSMGSVDLMTPQQLGMEVDLS